MNYELLCIDFTTFSKIRPPCIIILWMCMVSFQIIHRIPLLDQLDCEFCPVY